MPNRRSNKPSSQQNFRLQPSGATGLWFGIILAGAIAVSGNISGKFNNLSLRKPFESLAESFADLKSFDPWNQRPRLSLAPVLDSNLEQRQFWQQYQNRQIGDAVYLQKKNYTEIDRLGFSTVYRGNSVAELANLLKKHAKTDAQKARIIYAWIARNITYDVQAFQSRQNSYYTAAEVLQYRLAICGGYANLYQALGREMGLDVVIVEGFAKGIETDQDQTDRSNHAWNAVMIDGAWYLVDVTWGAGNLEDGRFKRQFNPAYFAAVPAQLIYSHHPTLDLWQMLPSPYSRQQFLALPRLKPEFFQFGLALQDATQYRLRAVTGRARITLKAPPNVIFTARLKRQNQILAETQTFVQRNGDRVEVNMAFPAAGTYQLEIYAKPQQAKVKSAQHNKQAQQQSYQLPLVANYELITTQAGAAFPKTYATYAEKRAYLRTPITATLPRNQSVNLEITVPNALDVAVIDQQTDKWTKLQKRGDLFVGVVKARGALSVSAKFTGGGEYWSLVTYQPTNNNTGGAK
ncbi:MAG: hypothetical protein DCE90_09375 [Pseudanabaena sp.]|nr:MAG: hypothetical protein DCE90_09375 [Pseudanabaena sp.]